MTDRSLPLYQPNRQNQLADRIHSTSLSGVFYVDHVITPDQRGHFAELALLPDLNAQLPEPFVIKQLNLAHSQPKVIRGFHAEGWHKLITLVRGTVFSVLLDLRLTEPTFGQIQTFRLGDDTDALKGCLYLPLGIANSVCVVNGPVDYLYGVDRLYRDRDPQGNEAISLFDPDLHIPWPIPKDELIFSTRDAQAQTLSQKFPDRFPPKA
ncbi:hypothetical protein A2W24_00920 [Microgenomates group bacterium RBG_16_45_19]|nr:MAG: hypothetical protein A2W24_00920 [Microgenomates group bacterium RBG_16_45_19]